MGIAIALAGAGALPAQPVPSVRTAAAAPAPAEGDPAARVEYKVAGASATGFEPVRGDGSRVAAERTAS